MLSGACLNPHTDALRIKGSVLKGMAKSNRNTGMNEACSQCAAPILDPLWMFFAFPSRNDVVSTSIHNPASAVSAL